MNINELSKEMAKPHGSLCVYVGANKIEGSYLRYLQYCYILKSRGMHALHKHVPSAHI